MQVPGQRLYGLNHTLGTSLRLNVSSLILQSFLDLVNLAEKFKELNWPSFLLVKRLTLFALQLESIKKLVRDENAQLFNQPCLRLS